MDAHSSKLYQLIIREILFFESDLIKTVRKSFSTRTKNPFPSKKYPWA